MQAQALQFPVDARARIARTVLIRFANASGVTEGFRPLAPYWRFEGLDIRRSFYRRLRWTMILSGILAGLVVLTSTLPLTPALATVHRRLKDAFDPDRLFNRGRLFDEA